MSSPYDNQESTTRLNHKQPIEDQIQNHSGGVFNQGVQNKNISMSQRERIQSEQKEQQKISQTSKQSQSVEGRIQRNSQTSASKDQDLPFYQKQQSFMFPRKSNEQGHRQSAQFQFNGGDSGSLFSSQKTQLQEKQQASKSNKNLQNLTRLLREYYNENYLQKRYQTGRKSQLMLHNSIRRSEVPYFITREPILFQKKFQGVRSAHGLSGNYLCKLIDNKIYYKNVSSEEPSNIDYIKCQYIEVRPKQSISPSLQIDAVSMHLFCYSNTSNEIIVMSLSKSRKNNQEICRVKTRTQRKNPILYLISINKQAILLLIGGYSPFNKFKSQQVQGCKFIEIFSIDKWGTDIIKSRLIRLINGKIYPIIVFPVKIEQNDSILLIGGNTMAKNIGNHLTFKENKVVNRSSNVRGVYINTKQIIECLQQNKDLMSLPHANNINVQIQEKVNLYNGYVDYVKINQKQKIRLFLPKMRQFYTMKIIKKQVRIIKSKQNQQRRLTFDSSEEYHHLQMKCFKKPTIQYYEINSKGFFKLKNINLVNNEEFTLENKIRCPCQFM